MIYMYVPEKNNDIRVPEKKVDLTELFVEIRGVAHSRFVRRPLCQKICHKMIFCSLLTSL